MVLDLCFDLVYWDVLLLCVIVMVLFSPDAALFLQMCCGVFLSISCYTLLLFSFVA
jgi:hypothetical protein